MSQLTIPRNHAAFVLAYATLAVAATVWFAAACPATALAVVAIAAVWTAAGATSLVLLQQARIRALRHTNWRLGLELAVGSAAPAVPRPRELPVGRAHRPVTRHAQTEAAASARLTSSMLELLQRTTETCPANPTGSALDNLKRTLDGFLAYTQIASSSAPMSAVDVKQVLGDVLLALGPEIQASGALVVYGPMPEIRADREQLRRIFTELIANAVKFRGNEPPQVRISAEEREHEWVFCVADNGIGFDSRRAVSLFKPFQRLETKDEYPGAGLGLAIARCIAERHGGRIWTESSAGAGAAFYFSAAKVLAVAHQAPVTVPVSVPIAESAAALCA